jgi:hypothetical protein
MDLPDNMDGYGELSMVNLPHLRTLRVTAWNKSSIIFALVIVPNPSESLTLENTSDHDDEPFSSQRGFDSLLLTRIHEFWEQRTGLTSLPPLSLSVDGSGDHTQPPDLLDQSRLLDLLCEHFHIQGVIIREPVNVSVCKDLPAY